MDATKDFKRVSFIPQSGPRIEAGTVQIYKGGTTLRISGVLINELLGRDPDEGESISFIPFISKQKQLVLQYDKKNSADALKTWRSSPRSKSILLSIAGLLPKLNLTEETAPGSYKAKVSGKELYISF